jgi:hypothetical protein
MAIRGTVKVPGRQEAAVRVVADEVIGKKADRARR